MPPDGRLRTVVVDDEAIARRRLCRLLGQNPEIDLIAECCEGREAVQVLLESEVDLLFLDVQMPEMDGFQVLRAVPAERTPVIVFVTAYDKYAIEAFEASATDYLLKPFHEERFAKALARAKAQARRTRRRSGQLTVRSGRNVILLNHAEIDWIEAANNYVCVHCGTAVHIGRETLARVETAPLQPAVRAHSPVGDRQFRAGAGDSTAGQRRRPRATAGWNAPVVQPHLPRQPGPVSFVRRVSFLALRYG